MDGLSSAHHGAERISAKGVRSFRDRSSECSKEQGGGGSRFAAVEVVAEGGHDAVDNSENAADDELHHAADADKGAAQSAAVDSKDVSKKFAETMLFSCTIPDFFPRAGTMLWPRAHAIANAAKT